MAERLGMTFGELSERMDAAELIEWTMFDQIYMPPARIDTALICLSMARLAGSKKAKLEDYLPPRWKPERKADPDLASNLKAWAAARIAAQRGVPAPSP
jgi:hypothetical protein